MTDFEQQIGPFRLYSEVGRTPIATKYRATDSRDGQAVAVYILNPDLAQQPAAVQQFLAIGRQAIQLRHPNIVSVIDADEFGGFAYVATQWVRGQSIGERLQRSGRTADIETAIHLVKGAADALDYAHSHGFIHGQLSLSQLYITYDNAVVVDGFAQAARVAALSSAVDGENPTAPFSLPLFISPFLAPEQARTGQTTDPRTDVYSLGAVLYTILLGRPPFVGEAAEELLSQIIEKLPLPPENINPRLPAAMAYVLKSVLAKDPTIRYGSAGELANAFQQSYQWRAPVEEKPVEEFPLSRPIAVRPKRRRRSGAIVLLLVAALFGIILISSIGVGLLGEQFAFVRQSEGGNRLVAQVRSLFVPEPGVVLELTANPVVLTPVVLITLTPPTATQASQIAAQAPTTLTPSDLVTATPGSGLTTTVDAPLSSITSTQPATATATAAIPTLVPTPTLTEAPLSNRTVVTDSSEPALTIDPLGLLTEPVSVGTVVINGSAPPGSQVQLQLNGENSGTTTVKATGTWALIVAVAEPGDYDLVAQLLDTEGNVVDSAQHAITVIDDTITATEAVTEIVQSTATPSRTATAIMTATAVVTPTAVPTLQPSMTATNSPPTATVTPKNTAQPTTPPTPTATNTLVLRPTATITQTPIPTATVTNTRRPTMTDTPAPTATNTPAPTATRTNTPQPTATLTNTPAPTATNTPAPTATRTNTPRPTATLTNTPAPTATRTNTPRPTATLTNTPAPTATRTNTPRPTATLTNTPAPTATATDTVAPTATVTNTPAPTATNTPAPTATNTPAPTATNTPIPTATNTRPPTATDTPAPTATPTAVTGSVELIAPGDGEGNNGQRIFSWSANFTPSEGYAFELVFWKAGQDPLQQSFGMAAPTTNLNVTLDLERLDEQLGDLFDIGEYQWGILLVRTTPAYERVQYLGGGRRFLYSSGSDSGPGSGGPSSGE